VRSLAMLAAALLGGFGVAAAAPPPLTIEECVQRALDRAPSVQAAAAESAAAYAKVRAARAAYWPRLIGQAQYGHSEGYDKTITNGGVTQIGVAIEAPLLDGGKRAAELAGAQARLQSAGAQELQRRADVVFAVRTAYHTAIGARQERTIQADAVEGLERYLVLLRRQEALGLVPVTDVPRAQLAVETARTAERAADAALIAAAQELSHLVGSAIDPDALVAPALHPIEPINDAWVDASPVVADARASANAARQDAESVRSEARSHLLLNADAGFLGVNPRPTFENNGGGEFLVGFTLPLFDGGAMDARIAAAAAEVASAEAKVAEARETVLITLARTRAEAARARADATEWAQTVPSAAENFLLLRARYFGGGDIRLLDVLDALNQSVEARLEVVRAEQAAQLAAASEAQLLGQIGP